MNGFKKIDDALLARAGVAGGGDGGGDPVCDFPFPEHVVLRLGEGLPQHARKRLTKLFCDDIIVK